MKIRHGLSFAALILGCQAPMTDLRAQFSGVYAPESLNHHEEESRRIMLEVQATCATEGKVVVPVDAADVGAYRCIGPHDPNFLAAQRAIQYLEGRKEVEESLKAYARVQALEANYHAARVECARNGNVVLVTSTTPDGQHARFDCVSPDDARYKDQHAAEQVAPAPPTDLDIRLKPWIGRNVDSVVALVGGPQGEPIVNGDVVYTWSCATWHYFPHTDIINDNLTSSCDMKLATDRQTRVIKSFEWNEQRGGCWPYAQKLDGRGSP